MEENNKIIAEFMGLNNLKDSKGDAWDYMNTGKSIYTLRTKNLHYESDWNWLMKVVEKIENTKIKDYSISTDITDDKTFINVWHYGDGGKWSILISNYNEEYKDFNKIQRTYKAIIEFINFYNKQKEE